jgi:hypothetical protein
MKYHLHAPKKRNLAAHWKGIWAARGYWAMVSILFGTHVGCDSLSTPNVFIQDGDAGPQTPVAQMNADGGSHGLSLPSFAEAMPMLTLDGIDSSQIATGHIAHAQLWGGPAHEIIVSEALLGQIVILTDCPEVCDVQIVSEGLYRPVRAVPSDIDFDGDIDLIVSDIANLQSSETIFGQVVWLENIAANTFETHVMGDGLGRIACAEPGDLDRDGDLDVVVCVFGAIRGSILWLEQQEDMNFVQHELDNLPGAIHAFPFDADGDGDLDIAASISQVDEEVAFYRNDGNANFTKTVLHHSEDPCFGNSGIEIADLDRDGDLDIIATNGDQMDDECRFADAVMEHGIRWLENDGAGNFVNQEIVYMHAVYGVRVRDLDNDEDLDLIAARFVHPAFSTAATGSNLAWLENEGDESFVVHEIGGAPNTLIALEVFDYDSDGLEDIFVGSMNFGVAVGNATRVSVHLRE